MGKSNGPSLPRARRSDPLPPISRIEARSYSHLLLDSSPSSPGATTTPVSTPTTANRRRPRPPPRPLRALALRRALARALDETLAVLERATADLNALLPRDSPLLDLVPTKPPPHARSPLLPVDSSDSEDPDSEERDSTGKNDAGAEGGSDEIEGGRRRRRRKTRQSAGGASIAELLRHDERARRERDELDKFNNNNNKETSGVMIWTDDPGVKEEEEEDLSAAAAHQRTSSSCSGHDPATTTTMTVSDPYHPTENTFGGIERRRHASLNSPAAGAAVRLRDSLTLSSASPLRRSHHQSLSPRVDGPSSSASSPPSLEEEIIAAAARDAGQGEAAETSTSRMMMMTPNRNRGAPPRFSTSTSSVATPPPPPTTTDSWRSARRRRRPVSLGGVSAPVSASLRRALSVQNGSTTGGGGGGQSARGAEEAAAVAESSSPSSSSSSSKSSRSGSPTPGRPLSATSSSPSPDPARLPPATEHNSANTTTTIDVVPFLLISLQDTFDDLHALRRGVIWRLLEALSGAESDRNWNALAGVVGGALAERLEEIAKEVEAAQERESLGGGGGGGGDGGGGGSSAADMRAKEMERERERERRKEKEKRRRSGAYARELLDDDDDDAEGPDLVDVDDEVEEENVFGNVRAGRTGQPATSSRRDALARLTGTPTPTPLPTPSSSRLDKKTKQNRRAPPASYADFAPPSASSSLSGTADPDLVGHARSMALALRAIEAKLRLVVDEVVAHSSPSGSGTAPHSDEDDDDGKRRRLSAVVEMYRGIGVELKRLEEQWRIGGEVLERAAGLVQPVLVRATPASAEDAEADPSVAVRDVGGSVGQQEEAEGRNQLGAEDAVLQTESSAGPGEEDDDDPIANRQALVDAALSASLLIPPSAPAEEKVFEAVAGPVRNTSSDGGSNKFSREERIRRMKEAREALARGRESLESSPVKTRTDSASSDADAASPLGSKGGSSSSLAQQQKMVGELQEVLREYNRERGRNVGGPDPTAAATFAPLTPTKTSTTNGAALPPLSLPPPPPPVPFPVASPSVASSPPPRATFALPPPPPPPAHRQPVMFASTSTSTSPQKALPQTPPRNAISPISGLRGRPTPPPVQQSPLGQKGTPSAKRYSVQSV